MLSPPSPLAFEEILEGHPMRASVRAIDSTICLSIGTEAFLSLLSENVELAEGMMRWFIQSHPVLSSTLVLRGDLTREMQRKLSDGLQQVETVLLLQRSPLLKAASGAQLLRLAACARPVTLKTGLNPLAGVIEPSMLIVLTGSINVATPEGGTQTADAGDVIGMYQALAGRPLGAALSAATDGTALRFNRSDVLDVLADDTALLQSVFAGLLQAALRSRAHEAQPA
jgi:CRP-like cAMP-binding protein